MRIENIEKKVFSASQDKSETLGTKMAKSVKTPNCSFEAKVWKYEGKAGWYFVTLPKPLSKDIRKNHGLSEEGWGRLKVVAQTGKSKWNTAIWYDTKTKSYLLPIKSEIRKKEKITADTLVKVRLQFEKDTSLPLRYEIKLRKPK